MDINTNKDIEANDNSPQPLSTPHFDAAMISQAQQVEPLKTNGGGWRPRSTGSFFSRRLAALAVILVVLLLGAAAVGMVLGLRDRQSAVEEPATANQATPIPTDTEPATPVVKTPVVKAPVVAPTPVKVTRAQRAETREAEPKLITPERVRRTVRVGLDDIDQALSPKGQKPAARKVGEIFGDSRPRRVKSKHGGDDQN